MYIPIIESDVITKLSGPENAAMQTAALKVGQTNPLPEIITQVIREVRAYVATCERNTLGEGATIPDELLGAAINRIRFELATRLPVTSLLTEDRRTANRDAVSMLRDAAACKLTVEQPSTPTEEVTASSPSPRWKARKSQFSRRQQDGA